MPKLRHLGICELVFPNGQLKFPSLKSICLDNSRSLAAFSHSEIRTLCISDTYTTAGGFTASDFTIQNLYVKGGQNYIWYDILGGREFKDIEKIVSCRTNWNNKSLSDMINQTKDWIADLPLLKEIHIVESIDWDPTCEHVLPRLFPKIQWRFDPLSVDEQLMLSMETQADL